MAEFEVKVRSIGAIAPHPNADRLDIATIDGYQFIVGKGNHKPGDLGIYIPEGTVVPDEVIAEMGLEGKLAGSNANRVKAIKLRGTLSQGLFYVPDRGTRAFVVRDNDPQGDYIVAPDCEVYRHLDDVAKAFGFTKYEPPIPREMAGEVEAAPGGIFASYDIEDIKKFPGVIMDREGVSITEKLHGTCCIVAIIGGREVVSSKGLAAKHLVLKESPNNVYWRAARENRLFEKLHNFLRFWFMNPGSQDELPKELQNVVLYGEVLGVQDLMYGLRPGSLSFRAFDIATIGGFLRPVDFFDAAKECDIPTVPELFRGDFTPEVLALYTNGQSTLAGHIREGVVIKPYFERRHPDLGRVALKNVSEAYLLRKNATELN